MRAKVNVNSVKTKLIEIIRRSFDSAKWVKCRLGDGYGRSLSSPAKQREQPEKWRLVRFLAAQDPVTISTRSENIETPADSLSGQLTFPEQLSGWNNFSSSLLVKYKMSLPRLSLFILSSPSFQQHLLGILYHIFFCGIFLLDPDLCFPHLSEFFGKFQSFRLFFHIEPSRERHVCLVASWQLRRSRLESRLPRNSALCTVSVRRGAPPSLHPPFNIQLHSTVSSGDNWKENYNLYHVTTPLKNTTPAFCPSGGSAALSTLFIALLQSFLHLCQLGWTSTMSRRRGRGSFAHLIGRARQLLKIQIWPQLTFRFSFHEIWTEN